MARNRSLIFVILNELIRNCPGKIGRKLRGLVLKKLLKACGPDIEVGIGVYVSGFENIEIGNRVRIGNYSSISAAGGRITIGDDVHIGRGNLINAVHGGDVDIGSEVLIGPNVVLNANSHVYASTEIPIARQGTKGAPIAIESDVWIGAGAIVLPGVHIGQGVIVGAGSVIATLIAPYTIVTGSPPRRQVPRRRDVS